MNSVPFVSDHLRHCALDDRSCSCGRPQQPAACRNGTHMQADRRHHTVTPKANKATTTLCEPTLCPRCTCARCPGIVAQLMMPVGRQKLHHVHGPGPLQPSVCCVAATCAELALLLEAACCCCCCCGCQLLRVRGGNVIASQLAPLLQAAASLPLPALGRLEPAEPRASPHVVGCCGVREHGEPERALPS